jgi:hypothetical protein
MKIILKNPEISTPLVVLSIVTIVILGPQFLSQPTFAHQPVTNSTTHGPALTPKLNATNSVSIPVSRGYVNGKIGYFIATDASDTQIAASITNSTGFKVNFSPTLALSPESSRQQGYDFINGIKQSSSPMGFQLGVSSASPGEKGYSPLFALNFVKWNTNATPHVLKSASEILSAERNGELTISKTGIVINSPEVILGK